MMHRCSRVHASCFKSIVSRQVWDDDSYISLGMDEPWKEAGQMPRLPSVLHVLQVQEGVEWHGEKAMLTWTRRKGRRVQDPTGEVWWDMIELCM